MKNRTIIAIASLVAGACSAPTAPDAFTASNSRTSASLESARLSATSVQQQARTDGGERRLQLFARCHHMRHNHAASGDGDSRRV
jgi:hypothetical protein